MGDTPLVRHDTPSAGEVSVSGPDVQVLAAPQHPLQGGTGLLVKSLHPGLSLPEFEFWLNHLLAE